MTNKKLAPHPNFSVRIIARRRFYLVTLIYVYIFWNGMNIKHKDAIVSL